MRHRIEDLGRLLVLLEKIYEFSVKSRVKPFCEGWRNKDFADKFLELDKEKQYDYIHEMVYAMSELEDMLQEAISIARGHDALNESEL